MHIFNCKQCGNDFGRKNGKYTFCSRSCANTYHNVNHKPSRKFGPEGKPRFCKKCGEQIKKGGRSLYCDAHKFVRETRNKSTNNMIFVELKPVIESRTMKDMKTDGAYKSNAYSAVRDHARKVARLNNIINECFICGYTKIVQACHIIPITKFDENTTLAEINNPKNIIGLCPNHHWEMDHNALSEEDRKKLNKIK